MCYLVYRAFFCESDYCTFFMQMFHIMFTAVPFSRESIEPGLVARVYPAEELVGRAVEMAAKIASMSLPVTLLAKEATNAAFEGTLTEGCRLERRMFHSCFALVRGEKLYLVLYFRRGDENAVFLSGYRCESGARRTSERPSVAVVPSPTGSERDSGIFCQRGRRYVEFLDPRAQCVLLSLFYDRSNQPSVCNRLSHAASTHTMRC